MNYGSWEVFNTFEIRHVWCRKVPKSDHQIIKFLRVGFIHLQIVKDDSELLGVFVVIHPTNCCVKANEFACITLLNSSLDIIKKYRPRRVGGYGFFKMIVKGVVGKL